MSDQVREWDAAAYERLSAPQQAMAQPVLDRLELAGDETVLDAGCGSGGVTRALLDRLPRGRVIAVDGSADMVAHARAALPEDRAEVFQADLVELELAAPVDAVFSNAVFHWITDHGRLFERLAAVLRPGGRLSAQCGGEGNIAAFHAQARTVANQDPYAEYLGGWIGPWNFASPAVSEGRLRAAGFAEAKAWLEPRAVEPEDARGYLTTVCLGPHLERLPAALRDAFVGDVLDRLGPRPTLDYVRLNLVGVR